MIDPLILVRSVHIGATVLACGTVAFGALAITPHAALRRQFTVMTWSALAVAILSGLAWLVLLATEILGGSIADICLHGGALSVLTETRFGLVWSVRLALALLLGLLTLRPDTRVLQLIAAAALVASLALVGHAGATPGLTGRVHLASDMVHLLAAGAWLGGLPAFALMLANARADSTQAALAAATTRRFSIVGIVSVAALLATGAINSWNLLGGPRDLVETEYGRLLALKIGLFAAMVGIAAVNRYYLTKRLPAPGAMRVLQRNSLAEIGLGLGVLMFVGALGNMPPVGHVHVPTTEIPSGAAFVHIHTAEAMAGVTIDPGRAGVANVTIRVSREDSTLLSVKAVRLALDPPAPGGAAIERAAERRPDGTWTVAGLEIGQAGIWMVRLIITPETGEAFVLDAPVVIER